MPGERDFPALFFKEDKMSKRAAGEGSIFKRGNKWVAQVGSGDNRETAYFRTQQEANKWRHEKNEYRKNGLNIAGAKTQLSIFLEEWLEVKKTSIRPNTFNDYAYTARNHIGPVLGKIKLCDLTPNHLQTLYTDEQKRGKSARTVIGIHAVMHCALQHALKLGLVSRNVADSVTRPKVPRKEMKVLDQDHALRLIQQAEGSRYQFLFWFAITTGLRQGELFGIKWEDVSWQNQKVQVKRQVQRRKDGLKFCEPKSERGRRIITLGKTTISKLKDHYLGQQKEMIEKGEKWQNNDLIFCTPIGTPLEPANVLKVLKKCLRDAGLPQIRFHDLRHTAATLMLLEGINPKIVQERLGHKDISLTLNTYSHVLPSLQEEAAEKMDELLTIIPIDLKKESKMTEVKKERIYP